MEEVHGAGDKRTAKERRACRRGWSHPEVGWQVHPSPKALQRSHLLTKFYFLLSSPLQDCPTIPSRDKKLPPQARIRTTNRKGS